MSPRSSASPYATCGHRPPSWGVDTACPASGQGRGRPFFPGPSPAPRPAGRITPSGGNARGTSVLGGRLPSGSACPTPDPPPTSSAASSPSGAPATDRPSWDSCRRDHRFAAVPGPPREHVCWLIPSRRQTSGTFMPFPRSTSACRSEPTICSALRRFFIREPFPAPAGARGFSHETWAGFWHDVRGPGDGGYAAHPPLISWTMAVEMPVTGLSFPARQSDFLISD